MSRISLHDVTSEPDFKPLATRQGQRILALPLNSELDEIHNNLGLNMD